MGNKYHNGIDIEYKGILWQSKNCRQFRFLTFTSYIGQFVHPELWRGGGYRCFNHWLIFNDHIESRHKDIVIGSYSYLTPSPSSVLF